MLRSRVTPFWSPSTRRHSSCWTAAVAACVVLPAAVAQAVFAQHATKITRVGFAGAPIGQQWPDDTAYGAWYSLHDGFGRTKVELSRGIRVLTMTTRAATTPNETFSSLVRTRRTYGDVDFTVSLLTSAQLRSPASNPWEVGWVLWHYTDNQHFYSFIVKWNGWELAKEDSAYPGAQRFLSYTYAPSFPIGRSYMVRVKQVGDAITVRMNGLRTVRYVDRERPYPFGSIALYAEDSSVRYGPVELRSVDR
jgi:hypothetical protein